jgi:aspartyl-tRNA(Asn)/glutamyl-tRNA(Gln) amidotransferase subunit A
LVAAEQLPERPLAGKRIGVIQETTGAGVAPGVAAAVAAAVKHLESLGAEVEEVRGRTG